MSRLELLVVGVLKCPSQSSDPGMQGCTCLSEAPIAKMSVLLQAAHRIARVCLPMIGTFW